VEDVTTPANASTTPHTVEGLLRVVEERDAEVVLLKLMVDKLKLQLLRSRVRRRRGQASSRLRESHRRPLVRHLLQRRPSISALIRVATSRPLIRVTVAAGASLPAQGRSCLVEATGAN